MRPVSNQTVSTPFGESDQPQPSFEETSAIRAPRILLAEDNDDLRVLAQAFLESEGYEVLACSDGFQAMKILESPSAFDLLLSDIEMPGASGIDVACAAAALRPSLPVILTSGALLPASVHTRIAAAGWTFIAKPSPTTRMLTAIYETLFSSGVPSPSSPA